MLNCGIMELDGCEKGDFFLGIDNVKPVRRPISCFSLSFPTTRSRTKRLYNILHLVLEHDYTSDLIYTVFVGGVRSFS